MQTKFTKLLILLTLTLLTSCANINKQQQQQQPSKALEFITSPNTEELTLSKAIEQPSGEYIVSQDGFVVPTGMVIQGFNIHYRVSLANTSTLNKTTTSFVFSFEHRQGYFFS